MDVPATAGRERAVDLVPRRPADFGDDLAAYARSDLDGVAASRERRSPVQRAGADMAHIPPRLLGALLAAVLAALLTRRRGAPSDRQAVMRGLAEARPVQ